jgi:flagellar biogenesis protein FliO
MSNLTFIFVFVAVLALIGVAAWLVRRFASSRLGANTNRGRMPRLAVIDAAAVDGRRRLVLVRRDNVEHLLMIGGPTDIVVEPNIVRATPGREALPQRPPGTELPPRINPLPDAPGWSDGDTAAAEAHVEPQMPEPPPRPARPAFAEEVRRPPPIAAERERRSDPLAGFAAEPLGRPERPEREPRPEPRLEPRTEPRAEPRPEPMPPMPPRMPRGESLMPRANRQPEPPRAPPLRAAPPPPPPAAPLPPSADQNLAEMAQRLEAALRRPAGAADAPPVAPEPPAGRVSRSEPGAPSPAPKTGFENLEDEMASLLGRPKSPSS